jgi:hypothetical protein
MIPVRTVLSVTKLSWECLLAAILADRSLYSFAGIAMTAVMEKTRPAADEPSKSSPRPLQTLDSATRFWTQGIWNPLRRRSAFSMFRVELKPKGWSLLLASAQHRGT